MSLTRRYRKKIVQSRWFRLLRVTLHYVKIPGFGGVPLDEVIAAFIAGLGKSSLTNRAAAVSFKFFMAIFPGLIFLVNLIPFIPIENFHEKLIGIIEGFTPVEIYPLIERTILDVVENKKTGLLSVVFLIAMFFSTNGMNGLIKAFNESAFITETRKPLKQRLVAILLTQFLTVVLIVAVSLIVVAGKVIDWALIEGYLHETLYQILMPLRYVLVFVMLYFAVATIFFYAPARTMRWRFFSPGAAVSTFCMIFFTFLVSVYVDNFNNYNKIYGVLGSFPVILIWIFLNALSILLGFELNVSIRQVGANKAHGPH